MKSFGVVARIKAPDGYVGVWVNFYKQHYSRYTPDKLTSGGAYKRRVTADAVAKSYRHDCVYMHVRE